MNTHTRILSLSLFFSLSLFLSACYLAPLFNGTGVATKIINALANGIPVVTTPEGTRGLFSNSSVKPPMAVASTPEDFAAHAVRIMVYV